MKNDDDKKPLWLSVRAASEYVGVSRFTIYRAVRDQKVAFTRFGRKILIDRIKLDQQLAIGGISNNPEQENNK